MEENKILAYDFQLLEQLVEGTGGVTLVNERGYGRFAEDVRDAIENVMVEFYNKQEELEYYKEELEELKRNKV